MKKSNASLLSLAFAVAMTACGEDMTSEGPGADSSGGSNGPDAGPGNGSDSGSQMEPNFGPCSWTASGLIAATGDFATVGPEEAQGLDGPSRLVNFNNDEQDGIAARVPSSVFSGSGGSTVLTCGTDFGLFGNVPSSEAAGGVCLEGSRVTMEATPMGEGVWQGVLSVEEGSFLIGLTSPQRVDGSLTVTFTARARSPGQGPVCE